MAKTKAIFFLTFCFLFLANTVLAQGPCEIVHTQGIVPCSLTGANRCTLCHFFEMLNRIVNYILFCLIPPVAVFMLVIGGLLYIGAVFEFLPGGMETVSRAKRLFVSVIIGMLIAYSAWLIINLFLIAIGYRNRANWWQIQCGMGGGGGGVVTTAPIVPPPVAGGAVAALSLPFDNSAVTTANLNITTSTDGDLFTWQTEPLFGLAISGSVTLNSMNSFARVILEDAQGKEYLVFEAAGPFNSGTISFEKACKETCVLNGVIPKRLRSEIENAQLALTQKSEITAQNKDKSPLFLQVQAMGIENYQRQLLKEVERLQISIINNYNQQKGLRWQAGETGVSSYTYAEKKALLGTSGKLPNLMGLEYYKRGIFETMPPQVTAQTQPKTQPASNFPPSFDWRNRHGKNWMTRVKNQSEPKDCGSCWAHALAGSLEALANLYFNQQLNLDLSEQDLVSCAHPYGKGCNGVTPEQNILVHDYIFDHGICPENCFPYQADNIPCNRKCKNWRDLTFNIYSKPITTYDIDPENIKELLITKGPLISNHAGIRGHAMVLVGYDTDPQDLFIGIFKNSWGPDWGENGYIRTSYVGNILFEIVHYDYVDVPVSVKNQDLKVKCTDEDEDGYCWWGISNLGLDENWRKNNCPLSCWNQPQKDCDETNPSLGPYDVNYKCKEIGPVARDNEPPIVGRLFIDPPQEKIYTNQFYVLKAKVEDNVGVMGCNLYAKYPDGQYRRKHEMKLDFSYCKSCYASTFFVPDLENNFYIQCWDEARNISTGEEITIYAIPSPGSDLGPTVSKVRPTSATINIIRTFSVDVSDTAAAPAFAGVRSCDFYINHEYIDAMTLSSPDCLTCTASIKHKFTSKGTYVAYAKCTNRRGKTASGEAVNIVVSDPIEYVTVRPIEILNFGGQPQDPDKIEVNSTIRLKSFVYSTSGKKIAGCFLKINDQNQGQMNLGKTNCYDCTIWKDHIFTKKGVYSAYIKCVDEESNVGESERINITIIDKQCPQLEYPSNRWQRVWYDNKNNTCLGQGFNESNIKFDNNWQAGEVAFGKSDDIKLSSSRTINFPVPGEYTFTVGSDDGVKVWIDDVLYLDRWRDRSYTTDTFKVNLTAGNHKVRIDYYEKGGSARLSFSYQEPSGPPIGQYTLNVSKSGNGSGTITSSPSGINCGQVCSANFNSGTYINLTANPSPGSVFTGWSGACSGTGATCAVSMNANKSVTANFTSSPSTYNLSVNRNPSEGGTVYSGDYTINCGSVCSAAYNPGKSVTLYASPAGGYVFSGWTGGGCSGTGSCTVTMNSNQTVTANFNRTTVYNLTINKNVAAGGIIQGTPAVYCGTNCGPKMTIPFDAGTTVTLSATPASGYTFGGWSGACSGTGTCTITMNSDKSLSASFIGGSTPIPTPTPTRTPTPTPTSSGTWTPCDPTYGWQCDRITGGNPPYCSGTPISWGSGDDGLVYCPEGQIAIRGICEKKNDDYVKESKEIINLLPHPQVVSSTPTIFKPRSAWYCRFGCTGLFCGPDGCGWAYCKAGQIQIQRIELQIFDARGRLVFQRTVDNQNQISWDGKNDRGEYLANGFYIFQAKTYLKDGRTFTNQDNVYIQR